MVVKAFETITLARVDDGAQGIPGKDGKGITSTTVTYQASTSGTTAPTGTWLASPTAIAGQYQWTRTVWTYTDGTNEVGYSVGRIGANGATGKDGVAGKPGVGIKSTSITYQSGTSGTVHPTGTWVANPPSVTGGNYLWTRTIWSYTDGSSETGYSVAKMGEKGEKGATGKPGADGKGIASTTVNYQASTSGTSIPTGTWLATIPTVAANQYLWTRTTWKYTDNTSANGYSVGKMGSNGAKGATGNGIKSVVASYQNATSGTVIPSGAWSATPPNTPQGQYLWTRNLTTFTNGSTSTSYSVAYSAKDGQKGDKGDPGSDNVPYIYTQTATPSAPKPKENDIWFVGTSWQDTSAIKRYVGDTWVTDNFSQAVLNIKQLNAVQINGSTISGSMFVNNFDFYDGTMHYVGSMNIGNANYTVNYDLTETGVDDKNGILSISPQRFSNTIYRGKSTASPKILDTSVELFGDALQFVQNTSPDANGQVLRITNMMSGDVYDTGWQKLTFSGGAVSKTDDPVCIRRIGRTVFLRGALYSPIKADYVWCNLPAVFRPTVSQRYTVFAQNNNLYRMIFWISKDGNMRTEYNETDRYWYWLSGINWQMDKPDEEGF